MTSITVFEPTFSSYNGRFDRLADYMTAVMPGLLDNRRALPIFVESTVVLLIAWHEDFLCSLVAGATRAREPHARDYFTNQNRRDAATCDLRSLIAIAKSRVHFRDRGEPLKAVFVELLGFSPWPNDDVRDKIVDLNLVRQLVVHHTSGSLGDDYWSQFADKTLLSTKQYEGLPAIRRLAHDRVLLFIREVVSALKDQAQYLRTEMLRRPEWVHDSPLGGGGIRSGASPHEPSAL